MTDRPSTPRASDRAGDAAPAIAIVGMAGLFPGAPTIHHLWDNILAGVDSTTDAPATRWDPVFFDPEANTADRFYCRRGGFVDDLAQFDPTAFGIMPLAVDGAEPDQLLALAAAAAALADAGHPERRVAADRVGVIIGRGGYLNAGVGRLDQRVRVAQQLVEALRSLVPDLDEASLQQVKHEFQERLGPERPEASIGLVPNLAASRIANRLDFRGPAYTLDAACASSLIAVDQGMSELASGRCDLVLAGGVHHCHDLTIWSVFTQLRALSPTQQIRPFSQKADGILIGEGTGLFALKRLADAERDDDRIYAVIRGSGVSSDGRATTLMSPEPAGQVLALERAWAASGLDPATVGLIEAHGTATPAGDAAELSTLRTIFGPADGTMARAGLGSVKSMIGHAMPAAGAAGLAKAALAVHHGILPPTLHAEDPNPAIDDTRFRLITEAEPWDGPGPRRAGVNAFGFGGINAHLVIEQHRAGLRASPAPLLQLGLRHPGVIGTAASAGADTLQPSSAALPQVGLRHPAHSDPAAPAGASATSMLSTGSGAVAAAADGIGGSGGRGSGVAPSEVTLLLAGESATDLLVQLGEWDGSDLTGRVPQGGPARLGIVDPNPKRLELARRVLERGTAFRGRNDVWFEPHGLLHDGGKVAYLFPGVEPVFEPRVDDVAEHFGLEMPTVPPETAALERQSRGILALGRLLATALDRLAIRPDVIAGHSLGEWTGQIVSGMVPAAYVDEFVDRLRPGAIEVSDVVFLALGCGADVAAELVDGIADASVSHDNCPHQSVVCGTPAAIEIVQGRVRERKVMAQELPFRSGFHSPLFEPFVSGLAAQFADLVLEPPTVPLWSATIGAPYPEGHDDIADLAVRHLVEPVRFRELVERLHDDGVRVFLQVGTGSLGGFVDDTLRDREFVALSANTAKQTGLGQLRRVATALWVEGAPVDFAPLGPAEPSAASAPAEASSAAPGLTASSAPLTGHEQTLAMGNELIRGLTPIAHSGGGAADRPRRSRPAPTTPLLAELQAALDDATDAAQAVTDLAASRPRRASAARSVPVTPAVAVTPPPAEPAAAPAAPDSIVVERSLSLAEQPYWADHAFFDQAEGWPESEDRFPLVPMTAIVEFLAEAAEALVPGHVVVAVEEIRAFKWLAVDPPTTVAVRASLDPAASTAADGERPATVAVRASIDKHARALVRLAVAYPEAPAPAAVPITGHIDLPADPVTLYSERHLFHGPEYQGVRSFDRFGEDGVSGHLESLPAPGSLLDNAGQLFGFWVACAVPHDRLVLPTSLGRISYYGPHPTPGTDVDCVVNVTALDHQTVRADLELTVDGRLWVRIDDWEDRRFQTDDALFALLRKADRLVVGELQPGGWTLVRESWPDSATRDVVMRRFLTKAERSVYEGHNPNVQRQWLLGRVAAKDAARQHLWAQGSGPLYPAEITVTNDSEGRPLLSGSFRSEQVGGGDLRVSLAHVAGLGVALVADGVDVGIDIEAVEPRPSSFVATTLTPAEQSLLGLDELGEADRDRRLTLAWVAKEAAAKAAGTGMQGRPRDFVIETFDPGEITRLSIGGRDLAAETILVGPDGRTTRPGEAAEPAGSLKEYVVAWTTDRPAGDR